MISEELIKYIFTIVFFSIVGLIIVFSGHLPDIKWGDKSLSFKRLKKDSPDTKNNPVKKVPNPDINKLADSNSLEKSKMELNVSLNSIFPKLENLNKYLEKFEEYEKQNQSDKLIIADLTLKNKNYKEKIKHLEEEISLLTDQDSSYILTLNKIIIEITDIVKKDIKDSCIRNHFYKIPDLPKYVNNKINYYSLNIKNFLLQKRRDLEPIINQDIPFKTLEDIVDSCFYDEFYLAFNELYNTFLTIHKEVIESNENIDIDLDEEKQVKDLLLKYYNYILSTLNNMDSDFTTKYNNKDKVKQIMKERKLESIIDNIVKVKTSKSELIKSIILEKQLEFANSLIYSIGRYFDLEFKLLMLDHLNKIKHG